MKSWIRSGLTPALAIAALTLFSAPAAFAQDGFRSLFNGTDLSGWSGNPLFWSVRDGAITGQTTQQNPTKGNTFIIWTNGVVDDFELHFKYKIIGGNSGVQYRSKVINKDNFGVGGYQADFEAGTKYSGILYDEGGVAGGRGIMAERGEKVVFDPEGKKQVAGNTGKSSAELQAAIKSEDWNDYVIIAQGAKLIHKINGNTTIEVEDNDSKKRLSSGVLALQLHAGPPMKVQFKEIRLKKLSSQAQASSDLDRLQGEWAPSEIVANGDPVPSDDISNIRVKIKDKTYAVEGTGDPDNGTFTISELTTPKQMDVTSRNGNQILAIYQVSGDTFKACYSTDGSSRPTEFKSAPGSGHIYSVYKRKP